MDIILEHKAHGNLFKLAKGLDLLAKARVRKIGYEKWNKSALWFSTYEQGHRIIIITAVIKRLESYCYDKCLTVQHNI